MANDDNNNNNKPSFWSRDWFPLLIVIALLVVCALTNGFASLIQTFARNFPVIGERLAPFLGLDPLWNWIVFGILPMVAFLGWLGKKKHNRWLGVLIDSNYTLSLSRLQVTLWTILALSAYLIIFFTRLGGLGELNPNDPLALECKQRLAQATPTATPATAPTTGVVTDTGKLALNVDACGGGALQIIFPEALLLAMGISLASFAGSALVDSNKKKSDKYLTLTKELVAQEETKVNQAKEKLGQLEKDSAAKNQDLVAFQNKIDQAQAVLSLGSATPDEKTKAAKDKQENQELVDVTREEISGFVKSITAATQAVAAAEQALQAAQQKQDAATEASGVLFKNANVAQASITDLFTGVEQGNHQFIDLSRVQMFFFTIVLVLAYAADINALLHNPAVLRNPLGVTLPQFSESMNILLGFSHSAYLAVKNVDHTSK